ncbi:MAG: NTP transferase domain-containing protein [Planctomycetes bacterium]|nr:NTP transferase domain-containing protein [Planctomycetota bacterium]
MRAGILAAGTGARLRAGGIATPKPLVKVGGRALIDRLLDELRRAGVTEVVAITNDAFREVADHLRAQAILPVRVVVKTTASSFESLCEIAPHLEGEPFLLSTVDAIYSPGTLARFALLAGRADGRAATLALTDYVDDEKPLRVLTNAAGRITRLGSKVESSRWITAGFYHFNNEATRELVTARERGLPALRGFLEHLVERGLAVYGEPVGRTADVDRPNDIESAERLLEDTPPGRSYLAVLREEVFSPGKVEDDARILRAVAARLVAAGDRVSFLRGEELPDAACPADEVLAMCQGERALTILSKWEAAGVRLVNTPSSIRNCYRDRMTPLLSAAGVPFPESRLVPTRDLAAAADAMGFEGGLWVKRGDVHATHPEDVTRAAGPEGLAALAERLAARGISRVALQRSAPGRTVKFYALADASFFRYYPPDADAEGLRAAAQSAAAALGVDVFGGDAQVAEDGRALIIDLNDWPTFSRCREDAADAIARYVLTKTR